MPSPSLPLSHLHPATSDTAGAGASGQEEPWGFDRRLLSSVAGLGFASGFGGAIPILAFCFDGGKKGSYSATSGSLTGPSW